MKPSRMSRLTLAVISFVPHLSAAGYSWHPNSNQLILYDQISNPFLVDYFKLYNENIRRSTQATQRPPQPSTSAVPQRSKNDTTGAQDVKPQRRQRPFRTGSTSSPHTVANLELVKQQTVATRNKYAKAADILAGKGLLPAANFSFVEEWNKSHDWDDLETSEFKLEERDGSSLNAPLVLKSYTSGNIDILYYGNISLGSPPQLVSAEIDSGSADLWVTTTKCVNCDSSKSTTSSPNKRQYEPSISTTYSDKKDAFHVGYGTGSVCGVLSADKVNFNGLTVDAQDFGGVYKKTDVFRSTPNGGLLGLAFGTIATSKRPPFFENLLSARKVRAPYFGISLARGRNPGSELCLGCVNKLKWRGDFQWISVNKKSYWNIPLTGFRGTREGPSATLQGPISAAVDTGTSLIYFPSSVATSFYSTIPGSREASDIGPGIWAFPCDASLSIALAFGGIMFEMATVDFNLGRTKKGSPECVGAVIGIGKDSEFPSNLAIIGVAFLKSWYSVFDYSHGARIGFARGV